MESLWSHSKTIDRCLVPEERLVQLALHSLISHCYLSIPRYGLGMQLPVVTLMRVVANRRHRVAHS